MNHCGVTSTGCRLQARTKRELGADIRVLLYQTTAIRGVTIARRIVTAITERGFVIGDL